MAGSIDEERRAFGVERNEIKGRSLAAGCMIGAMSAMLKGGAEIGSGGATSHFGAADTSGGQSFADRVDCIVLELVELLGRAIPVYSRARRLALSIETETWCPIAVIARLVTARRLRAMVRRIECNGAQLEMMRAD